MSGNPIKPTSRDYDSTIADIDADAELESKPDWWKRIWAGAIDQMNRMIDAVYNLIFIRTVYNRSALIDLLLLIDYNPLPAETAFGTQRFNLNPDTAVFPFTLSADEARALTQSTVAQAALQFEARASAITGITVENATPDFNTDTIAMDATDWHTGDLFRFSGAPGTPPTPLQNGVNYYVIKLDDSTIQVAATLQDAYDGIFLSFTDNGVGLQCWGYWIKMTLYQQTSLSDFISLGQGNGTDNWQQFQIPQTNVIKDTVEPRINAVNWDLVDTLVDSLPSDTDVRLYFNSDNTSYLQFGNGDQSAGTGFGAKPGLFDVEVKYAFGGGANSNVLVINRVNIYNGGNADVVDTSNITKMNGGKDPQSNDDARFLGPLLLKSNSRNVLTEDAVALSLNFGGITKVQVNRLFYGPLSEQVLIVPTGGGLPSPTLKTDLQTLLINRSLLEQVDARVEDPTYFVVDPTSDLTVNPSFDPNEVKELYELAWILYFSEITPEIVSLLDQGIESVIDFINDQFSRTFTTDQSNEIRQLVEAIKALGQPEAGATIQDQQVEAYILSNVDGIDLFVVSNPVFPIVLEDNGVTRFTTIGTFNTTLV